MRNLRKPYLLFLAGVTLKSDAKTGFGLRDWCPDDVIGEWALPQATVSLGLQVVTPADAAARGAGSLLIGVAPVGGQLPESWIPTLVQALDAGLDIVSGWKPVRPWSAPLHAAAHAWSMCATRTGIWPQVRGASEAVDVC